MNFIKEVSAFRELLEANPDMQYRVWDVEDEWTGEKILEYKTPNARFWNLIFLPLGWGLDEKFNLLPPACTGYRKHYV